MSKFNCEQCGYSCKTKFLWKQHCLTKKHLQSDQYMCEHCGKTYRQRAGLWKHKKTCIGDTTLTMKMMEQIKEQNEIIKEMIPMIGNRFNINVYLNEKCRDAINMSDFIDSLNIEYDDLNYTLENGVTKGVSSILVNGLNQLEMTKRPIHCTDVKRETMYIKDNNKWNRDNDREKLASLINSVAYKQQQAVIEWEKLNPDWMNTDNGKDEYISLVQSIMKNECYENKIIKTIAKETLIDK